MSVNKPSPIDWNICVERASNDPALAADFLKIFIEELGQDRQTFIELFQQKNISALEKAAHKLHGACCYFGVPELKKHVISLEQLSAQNSAHDILEATLTETLRSIDDVITEYKTFYGRN